MARCSRSGALLVLLGGACLPDNPEGPGGDGTGSASGEGPLGCLVDGCELVLVSQSLDDRLDVFGVDEGEASYRGSIGFDLEPNPGGDISGSALDEPLGVVVDEGGLHLLVGHYPSLTEGSLFTLTHGLLEGLDVGAYNGLETHWDPSSGVPRAGSARWSVGQDPIAILRHPSGRLLITVFANDKFASESSWTSPGELVIVDPETGAIGRTTLAGCAGAWGLTALDEQVDRVAVACEGDEGVAILDTSGVGEGDVQVAADAIQGCVADVLFSMARVRSVAGDGEGGVLVAESPSIASFEDTRLWWFGADCSMRALAELPGDEYPRLEQLARLPTSSAGPYWLLASAGGSARGVHVLDGSSGEVTPCARFDVLDALWGDLEPRAMDVSRDGRHVVVSAGPTTVQNAGPADARVYWLERPGAEACDGAATVLDLTATAPAVNPAVPETWRRGPNAVRLVESSTD